MIWFDIFIHLKSFQWSCESSETNLKTPQNTKSISRAHVFRKLNSTVCIWTERLESKQIIHVYLLSWSFAYLRYMTRYFGFEKSTKKKTNNCFKEIFGVCRNCKFALETETCCYHIRLTWKVCNKLRSKSKLNIYLAHNFLDLFVFANGDDGLVAIHQQIWVTHHHTTLLPRKVLNKHPFSINKSLTTLIFISVLRRFFLFISRVFIQTFLALFCLPRAFIWETWSAGIEMESLNGVNGRELWCENENESSCV